VQEVRWERGCSESADTHTFFDGMGMIILLMTGFFIHKTVILPLKKLEFDSNRMSCAVLRSCLCVVMHAITEDKGDDTKDNF
jgi:hypothetical protein